MYQIKCDDYPLLDIRDEKLNVGNPKCKTEVNTVGEGSFTIYNTHPYYDKLKKLKSIFEIADEFGVIFRGRMTNNSLDFQNGKAVDLEGAMAFLNDSYIEPFNFPEDFQGNANYQVAQNVIEFFLGWVLSQHNAQVDDFQRLKLGRVTVTDPNNYLSRSTTELLSSWEIVKTKLFDSALGGFLCIRYEADGNYIDYLSEFELTNTQEIEYGKNLLNLIRKEDAQETYSCIIPIGAEVENEYVAVDETVVEKSKLTLESIPDGDITEDIVKEGKRLYSKSARESYGMICAPVKDTTWDDVTDVQNLLTKGKNWLITQGILQDNTVEITAADLHFTDAEIRSFRIYRNITVKSAPHGLQDSFQLTKLDIDLMNPQNTKITVGETRRSLTDQDSKIQSETIERIESAEKNIEENRQSVTEAKNQIIEQTTTIINTCNEIILGALSSYTETGDFEAFKQTTESALQLLSNEMSLKLSETTQQILNVNGDIQETITTLTKFFDFTLEDGLIIKVGENQMQLQLDNDVISFKKNGQQFGWWDGVDFHTGNIIVSVNERAQFGGYAFIPRSDGSLSFMKVGE